MNSYDLRNLQEAYLDVYQDLDEMHKGRHGQSDAEYQKGRSDAGKRISGDEKTGPRYYTLRRVGLGNLRLPGGGGPDAPTAPGARPINTPKLSGSEKEWIAYIKRNPQYNRVGGSKGLPEEVDLYDIILTHLLDEGYAETPEAAEVMMVNMSEEWRESICEGLGGAKDESDKKRLERRLRGIEDSTENSIKKLKQGKTRWQQQRKADQAQEFLTNHPKKTK